MHADEYIRNYCIEPVEKAPAHSSLTIFQQEGEIVKTISRLVAALMAAIGLMLAPAMVQSASANGDVEASLMFTANRAGFYPRSEARLSSSHTRAAPLPHGARVRLLCEAYGQSVTSTVATTNLWDYTNYGWIPNALLETGVNGRTPGVSECVANGVGDAPVDAVDLNDLVQSGALDWGLYDRNDAVQWALAHMQDAQPDEFDSCTWFVSQALWAGGMPQSLQWHSWPRLGRDEDEKFIWLPGSPVATAANNLYQYLVNDQGLETVELDSSRFRANEVPEALPGDVIFYNYGGQGISHATIVTSISPGRYPNVAEWGTRRGGRNTYLERGWTWSMSANGWIQHQDPLIEAILVRIKG